MIADEQARLISDLRQFKIDQRITIVGLTMLLAQLYFADSISVMIESNVTSLFIRNLIPEIGLLNQFASADND